MPLNYQHSFLQYLSGARHWDLLPAFRLNAGSGGLHRGHEDVPGHLRERDLS